MTAVDTDAARVLRAAKFVARRWARSVGLDDASAEDVAQEIALRVILAHRRGYRCGRRAYAMMLRDARRALYGDERDGRHTVWRHVASGDLSPVPGEAVRDDLVTEVDELHGLRFARLREVWPTLTARQRAAALLSAQGYTPSEIGERLGTTMGGAYSATSSARARLADPSAYSRAASREGFRRVRGGAYVKVAP